MEFFSYINSIIIFVALILNIILFFKIWRMTADVKAIRDKYVDEGVGVTTDLLLGEKEALRKHLVHSFSYELLGFIRRAPNYSIEKVIIPKMVVKYNKIAKVLDLDIDFEETSKGMADKFNETCEL